jgi:hypothetical protein
MQGVIIFLVTSALSYLPGFLLAEPTFLCPEPDTGKLKECSEDLWCHKYYPDNWSPDMVDWKYDYSWVKERKIICEDGAERAQYKDIIMILSVFVTFVFITLSDSLGRVKTLKIALLSAVAVGLAGYLIDSILIKVLALSF